MRAERFSAHLCVKSTRVALTLLLGMLAIPISVNAATNTIDSAEWRNVSGFPEKNKVYYRVNLTKNSTAWNSFILNVDTYWVKIATGTVTWDSSQVPSIDPNNSNRANYGYHYSTGLNAVTSAWKWRTKRYVQTMSGTVHVQSSDVSPL